MSGEQERLPSRRTDSNPGNGGYTGKGPGGFGGRWDTGGDPIQAHPWVSLRCEGFEKKVSKLSLLQMRSGIFVSLSFSKFVQIHIQRSWAGSCLSMDCARWDSSELGERCSSAAGSSQKGVQGWKGRNEGWEDANEAAAIVENPG